MSALSHSYYEVTVAKTSKPRGNTQASYQVFDEERFEFDSIPGVREWLTKTYRTCKRVKIFRDLPDGQAEQVGWVYCFKNEDRSHWPVAKWWQQDWVEVRQIKASPILI